MNKMKNIKIIIVSESGYSDKQDNLILSLLDQGYELFCIVGKDCKLWEEIIDALAVGNGENIRYTTTTSHPDEKENEVIEFAEVFQVSRPSGVDVVYV